jgi:hypothetical protein
VPAETRLNTFEYVVPVGVDEVDVVGVVEVEVAGVDDDVGVDPVVTGAAEVTVTHEAGVPAGEQEEQDAQSW